MRIFEKHGIYFEYPDDWTLTEESGDTETTLTVEGPGTTFWSVTIVSGRPDSERLMESALVPFREMYPEHDVYESREKICLLPTVARDLDFVCLELISRACLRTCEASDFSLLVLYQTSELDDDAIKTALHEITDSLICSEMLEDDEPPFDQSTLDSLFRSR